MQALCKCLDVRGGYIADGTTVDLYTCNGTAAQQWTYDQATGELQVLGKCLDSSGGATSDSTPLVIEPCTCSTTQQ